LRSLIEASRHLTHKPLARPGGRSALRSSQSLIGAETDDSGVCARHRAASSRLTRTASSNPDNPTVDCSAAIKIAVDPPNIGRLLHTPTGLGSHPRIDARATFKSSAMGQRTVPKSYPLEALYAAKNHLQVPCLSGSGTTYRFEHGRLPHRRGSHRSMRQRNRDACRGKRTVNRARGIATSNR
jgi:hypothetical protein